MNRLLSYLNINEDERGRAVLLFLYQFLAVATMVQGRIVRDTLFLKRYDSSKLSLMYIGIAVIVSLATYFYIRKSFFYRIDKLIIGTFFISIAVTLFFLFLVKADVKISFPLLYIFIELMGAFMMFQFWSFVNELLDSREAKRILGFIGSGGVIASLFIGGSVREVVKYTDVENLLIINAVFMIACMWIVNSVGSKYQVRLQRTIVTKTAAKFTQKAQISVFTSPYVKYIALMTAFIFVVVTLVDYQFKMVAGKHFSEKELASFFGIVYAAFGGFFSLFFQFFATARLLRRSIFISLGVLPAMITIFSFIYITVPVDLIIFSWSAPLLAITMARASDSAFRYTINDASIQLLYIPLDPKIKSRAKALIDGMVKPLFIGISGVVIFIITRFHFNEGLISLLIFIVGIIWILMIIAIRKEYLSVLIDNIKKKRFGSGEISVKQNMLENIIVKAIESDDEEEIVMALDMIEKGGMFSFSYDFIPLLGHKSSRIKIKTLAILRSMESRFYTYDILRLLKDPDPDVVKEAVLTFGYVQMEKSINSLSLFLESPSNAIKGAAVISLIKYGGVSGIMAAAPHLKELAESEDEVKRSSAAYILGEIGQKNMQQQVFSLLNDASPIVRREAVNAAGKIGSKIFIPKLFYMLLDKNVSFDVSKTLAKYGELVLIPASDILANQLESYRLKSEVARMLGDIYSVKSVALLMKTLDAKSDEMRNIVLNSLKKLISKMENIPLDNNVLKAMLYKEIYQYFQILYYSSKIKQKLKTAYLNGVIETKLQNCYQRIFSILSLMYGNTLFDNVYFNITQRFVSNTHRSNALEIVDNMVEKDLRHIILPLIETKNDDDKLKLGYNFFKIKQSELVEILEIFLTDDSDWVRAITLYTVAQEKIMEISDKMEIFICDPSPVVREVALYTMDRLGIKISPDNIKSMQDDSDPLLRKYVDFISLPGARRTTLIIQD